MNVAVIFAGGQGSRLYSFGRPKQFLEFRGKPIVVYTIEVFQQIQEVDGIIVVCLEGWIPYLQRQIEKFHLTKVVEIVPGGKTGQDSIFRGLECVCRHYSKDAMVLIHDGVRPLAMEDTIMECIGVAKEKGNCVVCAPATETIIVKHGDVKLEIPERANSLNARAPQCFVLRDVLAAHQQAREEGITDFVDTCTMMHHYGHKIHTILGTLDNIKITTPADYFMFRAILEAREVGDVFGL